MPPRAADAHGQRPGGRARAGNPILRAIRSEAQLTRCDHADKPARVVTCSLYSPPRAMWSATHVAAIDQPRTKFEGGTLYDQDEESRLPAYVSVPRSRRAA